MHPIPQRLREAIESDPPRRVLIIAAEIASLAAPLESALRRAVAAQNEPSLDDLLADLSLGDGSEN